MRLKVAAIGAALLSLTTLLIEVWTEWYVDQFLTDGGIGGWLPQLETAGQTAVAYLYVSRAVTFTLSVFGIAALGYWVGLQLDLTSEYRSLLGYFAVGGGSGYLLAIPLMGLISGEVGSWSALSVVFLAGAAVATGIQFALTGLAGAALAVFGFTSVTRQDSIATSDTETQLDSR